jgi:hypothetical protein
MRVRGGFTAMGLLERIFGRRKDGADEQWQVPIVQEICVAMLRLVPQDWKSAYLVLEVTDSGLGSGLSHSAITRQRSADGMLRSGEFVTPDMEVMAATRKLELGWLERKKTFKRAIISATDNGDGWEIRSDYEHE